MMDTLHSVQLYHTNGMKQTYRKIVWLEINVKVMYYMFNTCDMEGSVKVTFEYWKAGSWNHKVGNMNFTLKHSLRMCTHGVKILEQVSV